MFIHELSSGKVSFDDIKDVLNTSNPSNLSLKLISFKETDFKLIFDLLKKSKLRYFGFKLPHKQHLETLSSNYKRLRYLDISYLKITELPALHKCPSLSFLNITGNPIGADSIWSLFKGLNFNFVLKTLLME